MPAGPGFISGLVDQGKCLVLRAPGLGKWVAAGRSLVEPVCAQQHGGKALLFSHQKAAREPFKSLPSPSTLQLLMVCVAPGAWGLISPCVSSAQGEAQPTVGAWRCLAEAPGPCRGHHAVNAVAVPSQTLELVG